MKCAKIFNTMSISNTYLHFVCFLIVVIQSCFVESFEPTQQQQKTPSFIKPCRKNDSNFNECLKHSFEHLRPYLIDGIDSLGIPAIEPLVMAKLVLESRSQSLNFIGNIRNISIHGISNFSINHLNVNLNNFTATIRLTLPKLKTKGNYDINGNVLLLPIRSFGFFRAVLYDIKAVAYFRCRETFKNGIKYLRVIDFIIDFDLRDSQYRVKDYLLKGHALSDGINDFLNKNSHEIINELKPTISKTLVGYIRPFLSNALLAYPLSVWIPDID